MPYLARNSVATRRHSLLKQVKMIEMPITQVKVKPFLKWVGGKGQLLSQFEAYYPKHFNNYFEPFFGGGAVFFSLKPSGTSYINDVNKNLSTAYSVVRDNVDKLIDLLKVFERKYTQLSEEEQKEYFYQKRSRYNALSHKELEKTAILLFLNKTCFNGLYRENRKGEFNVPFGKYKNPTIVNEDNLRAASLALQNTKILLGSFESAIQYAKRGDFVYFDPPYHPLNETSSFTSYSEDGFNKEDQVKLKETFDELSKRGCYVMLSNSDSEFIRNLYQDYRQEKVFAGRSINAKADKRSKITELVVLNY